MTYQEAYKELEKQLNKLSKKELVEYLAMTIADKSGSNLMYNGYLNIEIEYDND